LGVVGTRSRTRPVGLPYAPIGSGRHASRRPVLAGRRAPGQERENLLIAARTRGWSCLGAYSCSAWAQPFPVPLARCYSATRTRRRASIRCRGWGRVRRGPGQLGGTAFSSLATSMVELRESWLDRMHGALDIETEQREVTHGRGEVRSDHGNPGYRGSRSRLCAGRIRTGVGVRLQPQEVASPGGDQGANVYAMIDLFRTIPASGTTPVVVPSGFDAVGKRRLA
jgi:hypothetical protein